MSKSIREIYNIPQEAKVLLYVGNISKNKNQAQMVRAYDLLPEEIQRNTYVLFCGADYAKDGMLQDLVGNCPKKSHLILCGVVDKNEITNYYRTADGVVLLSFAEGFGLSLIEGMHFGLPCVMPKDLDAFEDIYDDRSVVAVKSRSDNDVAEALIEILTKEWRKDAIKDYSSKFESDAMAKKYKSVYQTITEG